MIRAEQMLKGIVLVASLSLGAAGLSRLPSPAVLLALPFLHQASLNQEVSLRTGTLKVLDVSASPQVTDGHSMALSPDGTFLVITLEFTSNRRPTGVVNLTVQATDGRSFGGLPPLGTNACMTSQPGIPLRCQIVIEMDKASLSGAKLRVPANSFGGNGDDVALIDLGLDTARAANLAVRRQPLTITPSTVTRGP